MKEIGSLQRWLALDGLDRMTAPVRNDQIAYHELIRVVRDGGCVPHGVEVGREVSLESVQFLKNALCDSFEPRGIPDVT